MEETSFLGESELLFLMVLSLSHDVINALGDIFASYMYRFHCQTVLALEQQQIFLMKNQKIMIKTYHGQKIMTKTQPSVAKSVMGNHIIAAGAVYPNHTTVTLQSGVSSSCCRWHH